MSEALAWLWEGKKETLGFAAHLSLFKIEDAPTFMTKERGTCSVSVSLIT
jgi:hypothetical protein